MEKSNNLTRAQVQEIVGLYPDHPASQIAEQFGKPISCIYKTAQRYGVKKSDTFRNLPLSGRIQKGQHLSPDTELKRGHVPWSKGKKLVDIHKNGEVLDKFLSNRFQKGHKPHTTKYDGAITIRRTASDGNGGFVPYKMIRLSEKKWEFLNRHLWEKHYGDIPHGYNVVFRDGNTMNCIIENLECISNAELGRRNSLHGLPEDIKELIYLKGSLTKAIKKATKNGND